MTETKDFKIEVIGLPAELDTPIAVWGLDEPGVVVACEHLDKPGVGVTKSLAMSYAKEKKCGITITGG